VDWKSREVLDFARTAPAGTGAFVANGGGLQEKRLWKEVFETAQFGHYQFAFIQSQSDDDLSPEDRFWRAVYFRPVFARHIQSCPDEVLAYFVNCLEYWTPVYWGLICAEYKRRSLA
jgi:hypothetical protein